MRIFGEIIDFLKKKGKGLRQKRNRYKEYFLNSWTYWFYYHSSIKNNMVYFESKDGSDLAGNMLRIIQEISSGKYGAYQVYLHASQQQRKKIVQILQNYDLNKVHVISRRIQIFAVMEQAKYLFSDSGMRPRYVKREGQVFISTWHGTPLKVMGKKVQAEKHSIGTVQKFFFSCDYMLFPNQYMKEIMLRDYMLENVWTGKVIYGGYPRNSIFFNPALGQNLKSELGFDDMQVFAYMPTHRGTMWKKKNSQQKNDVMGYLSDLDIRLKEHQVLLVKLHLFNNETIDYSRYQHIRAFPSGYDPYDILNFADCLITDYSSVLFDYANSGKKIILFSYDVQEYCGDRGLYLSLDSLPFPKVADVEQLWRELNSSKQYDDHEFRNTYCPYDSTDAPEKLCRFLFRQEPVCKVEDGPDNGKENILIFGGSLKKNGITTALVSLIQNIDPSQRNYFVSFRRQDVNGQPELVNIIPNAANFLPLASDQNYTFHEKLVYKKYSEERKKCVTPSDTLLRMFQREWTKFFANARFSKLIQFDGYGINVSLLFSQAPVMKKLWIHNDMVKELAYKSHIQHRSTLFYACQVYDRIAIVSPDLFDQTVSVGAPRDKIRVVENCHDIVGIRKRAFLPISFEKDTECTASPMGIEGILRSDGIKFISIGRFSAEKSHERLLDAFSNFWTDHPDSYLILIGGLGPLYNRTLKKRLSLGCWEHIVIIKSIVNPMPILKQCDCFVLSSTHEGMPMTIKEADILNVPVVSTDIPGPHEFLTAVHGHLVPNNTQGILQGMYDYAEGRVKPFALDYETYNRNAVEQFENLLNS